MKKDALLISALLAMLILVQLIWPISAPEPTYDPGRSAAGSEDIKASNLSSGLPEAPALDYYDPMQRRPLFIATRRIPSDDGEAVEEAPARVVGKPRFKMTAIIRSGNETYAMISSPTRGKQKQASRVKVGDTRDGWRVKEITDDRLILIHGRDQHELLLRTYKPVKPTAPSPRVAKKSPKGAKKPAAKVDRGNKPKNTGNTKEPDVALATEKTPETRASAAARRSEMLKERLKEMRK